MGVSTSSAGSGCIVYGYETHSFWANKTIMKCVNVLSPFYYAYDSFRSTDPIAQQPPKNEALLGRSRKLRWVCEPQARPHRLLGNELFK